MAKRKTKPVTLPPFKWDTDGDTGTTNARGEAIRAPLVRNAVELTSIKVPVVTPEDVKNTKSNATEFKTERVWRGKTPAIVSGLPETDREALAEYAYCVAHVGASSGALDPSGGGGSRPTPTGPSLSRIEAAQAIGRVHAALEPRVVKVDRALTFRRLIELLAIDEQSPTAIARKLDATPKERPSRPAFTAVKAAIPEAAALVAFALGWRSQVAK